MLTLMDFVAPSCPWSSTPRPLAGPAAPPRQPERTPIRGAEVPGGGDGRGRSNSSRVMAGVVAAARSELPGPPFSTCSSVTGGRLSVIILLPASIGGRGECEGACQTGPTESSGQGNRDPSPRAAGVNLLRRSVLGAGGPEAGREVWDCSPTADSSSTSADPSSPGRRSRSCRWPSSSSPSKGRDAQLAVRGSTADGGAPLREVTDVERPEAESPGPRATPVAPGRPRSTSTGPLPM